MSRRTFWRFVLDALSLFLLGSAVAAHLAGYQTLGMVLAVSYGLGMWSGVRRELLG